MADLIDLSHLPDRLAELPGWVLREDGKAITREFRFANFNAAFGFMTRAAIAAEKWIITRNGSMSTTRLM